jgi:vancomycin permeability regulator SanA
MFNGLMSFLKNPFQAFASKGINIPNNLNNADDVINYLLQSGKISQEQYNQAYSQYRNLMSSGLIPSNPYQK